MVIAPTFLELLWGLKELKPAIFLRPCKTTLDGQEMLTIGHYPSLHIKTFSSKNVFLKILINFFNEDTHKLNY